MPVIVGVAVGFWSDEVNPDGPVHIHVAPSLELALKLTVEPLHIAPLLVGLAVGIGFTVTVVV